MRSNSSNRFARSDSMEEVTECLKCGSSDLIPINFSANECGDCGFQQSLKLPMWGNMPSGKLSGFEKKCKKVKEVTEEDRL